MDGVTYETESAEVPTIGQQNVVTNITVPLDGLRQTYVNNVYLYVEAMKNLTELFRELTLIKVNLILIQQLHFTGTHLPH